jgi:hypothetical protein
MALDHDCSLKDKEERLPYRIIYCAFGCASLLTLLSHDTLRNFDQGAIVSVSDETMSKLLLKESQIPILYFSRQSYEKAIQGLDDPEIDAVLSKRRQYWSPNAAGHGLNWIYDSARRCLTLTALAEASRPSAAARLADHFQQNLQLLVIITGEKRYQSWSLASLLVFVAEGEAKLRKENLDAQDTTRRAGDSRAAERFAAAVKRSESYGQALGASLKSLGHPEFTQGLPYVGLSRGIFARPRDPELLHTLEMQHADYRIWKDGLVADWSLENLPELEKRGQSISILYFSRGQFLMDLQDLTPAQSEREFARRLEGGRGASMEERREYLHFLWLEQHLLRRKALAHAKAESPVVAATLAREVTEEAQALRQQLAMYPVWLEEGEKPGSNVFDVLKKSEEQLLQDARFFAMLCRREGDANTEALFMRIAAFKPVEP